MTSESFHEPNSSAAVSPVFLDTSGLIAVVNSDDQWHKKAKTVWGELLVRRTPLLTTSLFLIELGDGLSRVGERHLAVQLYDRLRNTSAVEIVRPTEELEQQGWNLFRERPDQDWGMTDCISFAVMTERSIREGFTLDHHFEQAGFVRLLK
jgi:predicted nucleic acid-binding protein